MLIWIQTLVSACVLVHSRPVTDAVGNVATASPRHVSDGKPPPVLLSQTRGTIYLQDGGGDSSDIWCNTTADNNVSWLYYDAETEQTTPLAHNFESYVLQQQKGIQVHIAGSYGNMMLHLYDQLGTHAHSVQCIVSNDRGAILGDRVQIKHRVFHVSGHRRLTKHAHIGDHVTLSCNHVIHVPEADEVVWEFTPTGTYGSQWLDMTSDDVICLPDKTICTLLNITTARAGLYRCYFHREAGTKYISHDLSVHVGRRRLETEHTSKVEFIDEVSSPMIVDVNKGESVNLQCVFIGEHPQPVSWYLQSPTCRACSGQIRHGLKYQLWKNSMSLTISQATEDDAGAYQCSLNNGRYLSTYEIKLRLVEPPVLVKHTDQFVIAPGESIRIACPTLNRFPNAIVTWWRNAEKLHGQSLDGRLLVNAVDGSLTLHNSSLYDTCSLTCNVSNVHGHALGYRHILVTDNPAYQINTTDASSTDESIAPESSFAVENRKATAVRDDSGLMSDPNSSITLKIAHFDMLWTELRTLEERIETIEGRLNSCLLLKVPSKQERIPQQQQHIHIDEEHELGDSNGLSTGDNSVDFPNEVPQKKPMSERYNIEIRLVKNVSNDIGVPEETLRHHAEDPDIFSTTCYGSNGCRLYSSTPISRLGNDVVDYVDDDDDDDDDAVRKKSGKRRKNRSSRSKFSDGNHELTHNIEQRDTYYDDRLAVIRVRYRIIQHSRTPGHNARTIWSETYHIEVSESGPSKPGIPADIGHLDLILSFNVGADTVYDVKTKVKVDIARDHVIGGERCLFRRDFYEWRVNYNNMDALTCHVV